jgi:hypothetical protein
LALASVDRFLAKRTKANATRIIKKIETRSSIIGHLFADSVELFTIRHCQQREA